MKDIATLCGGIGVFVMTFRTGFEQALTDQRSALDRTAGPMAKLAGMLDRLQKSMATGKALEKAAPTLADLEVEHAYLLQRGALMDEIENSAIAELERINETLQEARAATKRMHEALPDFEQWATPHAAVGPRFFVAEKASGYSGGDAKLAELFGPKAPPVDINATAADAMLQHRFHQPRE
jgi:hypothetical protein